MSKYDSLAIIISFFGLWVSSYLSNKYEIICGIILILTFGIFHGANDILISTRLNNTNNQKSKVKVLLLYVIQVLLALLLFYISPSVGLILFVLASAFHFGEQQFRFLVATIPNNLLVFYQLIYGLMLFFLLFSFNQDEVVNIVYQISDLNFSYKIIYYCFYVFLSVFVLLTTYFLFCFTTCKNKLLMQILYLLILAIIFKVSSLIWGFAIYFIVWHSIPSIMYQSKFIYGTVSTSNFYAYFKDAFIYWAISIVSIAVFYYYLKESKFFITILFSFFSAITYPHAFVIFKMFTHKKTE